MTIAKRAVELMLTDGWTPEQVRELAHSYLLLLEINERDLVDRLKKKNGRSRNER